MLSSKNIYRILLEAIMLIELLNLRLNLWKMYNKISIVKFMLLSYEWNEKYKKRGRKRERCLKRWHINVKRRDMKMIIKKEAVWINKINISNKKKIVNSVVLSGLFSLK